MECPYGTSASNDELTLESETTEIETNHTQNHIQNKSHTEEDDNDHNDNTLTREQPCSTSSIQPTNQRLEDTPRKKLLRKALVSQKNFYQHKIRTLNQRNKRQGKLCKSPREWVKHERFVATE